MAIKVSFGIGETSKSTSELYQWDYGQTLEIEAIDLPSLVEVHFACTNMSEAIVRVCNVEDGIARVTIPDTCLEQPSPITAWVYEIDGATGHTSKTITIPVVARKRPSTTTAPTQEQTDKYTELITEVNDAIEHITSGEIDVDYAKHSESATYAITAGRADVAENAETAVNRAGDTMTGALNVPMIRVHADNTSAANRANVVFSPHGSIVPAGGISLSRADTDRIMAVVVTHTDQDAKDNGERFNEWYRFPSPSPNNTESKVYNIHTTKETIAIEHGGTGATTADDAIKNLGGLKGGASRDNVGSLVWSHGNGAKARRNYGIYSYTIEGEVYDSQSKVTSYAKSSMIIDVTQITANKPFTSPVFPEFGCRLQFLTDNITGYTFYADVINESGYTTYDGIWELNVYAKPLFEYPTDVG